MKKFILHYYKRYPDGRVREDSEEIDYSGDNASLLIPYASKFSAWLMISRKIDASTLNYPATLGMHLIDFFNSSLSPGEPSREFIGTKEIDEDTRMKMENTMIRFETINGTLCRMVETEPLTEKVQFPVAVEIFGKQHILRDKYQGVIPIVYAASYMDMSLSQAPFLCFLVAKIIGYPVAEGSAEWALWAMMEGQKVWSFDVIDIIGEGYVAMGKWGPSEAIAFHFVNTDTHYECNDFMSIDEFLSKHRSSGWQLYKEPKIEPPKEPDYVICKRCGGTGYEIRDPKPESENIIHGHLPADMHLKYIDLGIYKVGDWVKYDIDSYLQVIEPSDKNRTLCRTLSGIMVYPYTSCLTKASPSEVVIQIGGLRGTVERAPYIQNGFNLVSEAGNCFILFNALDKETLEFVGSLLKAQEEEK